MPTASLVCRVCGKEYVACRSVFANNEAFRWQAVACCKEHGEQYIAAQMRSRIAESVKEEKDEAAVENTVAEAAEVEAVAPAEKIAEEDKSFEKGKPATRKRRNKE